GRRVIPRAVLSDHAPAREDSLIRSHIDIGERLPARLEEPFLIPLRDVMVVSGDRHRSDTNRCKPKETVLRLIAYASPGTTADKSPTRPRQACASRPSPRAARPV